MPQPEYTGFSDIPVEIIDTRPDRSLEYHPFECILDRILVRRVPQDDEGGLQVPSKYKEPQRWGTVIAIGDSIVLGGSRVQMSEFISLGDLVKFGEHTAEQFDPNDEEVYIIRLQDCRGRRRLKRG